MVYKSAARAIASNRQLGTFFQLQTGRYKFCFPVVLGCNGRLKIISENCRKISMLVMMCAWSILACSLLT